MRNILVFFIAVYVICILPISSKAEIIITEKDRQEEVIRFIQAFNFMSSEEYSDTNQKDQITRAEFAMIIAKINGFNPVDNPDDVIAKSMFNDVAVDYWAGAYIEYLAKNGIMSGEGGNFRPDEPIILEETYKAIIMLLREDSIANLKGGYPLGYFIVASDLKINNYVKATIGQTITRKDLQNLLYNMANTKMKELKKIRNNGIGYYTEGKTFLEEKFDVRIKEGILNGTAVSTLTGEGKVSKDCVQIDGETYKVGDTKAQCYLGYKVKCYYVDEEGSRTIKLIVPIEEKKLEMQSEDIFEVSKSGITYYDSKDGLENVKFSFSTNVIYNGKALPAWTINDLYPKEGNLVLIDNDGDNIYDTILVKSYEILIMHNVTNENRVYGEYDYNSGSIGLQYIDLKDDEKITVVVIRDGTEITVPELVKGDVLSIMRNMNGNKKIITIEVTQIKKTGSISEKSEDRNGKWVKMGDDTLYFSSLLMDTSMEIEPGIYGTASLDSRGRIVSFIKERVKGQNYGYLRAIGTKGTINKSIQFKILTQLDEWKVIDLNEKIEYNGDLIKALDLLQNNDFVTRNGESLVARQQLIRYETDQNGNIDKFNTATDISTIADSDQRFSASKEAIRNNTFHISHKGSYCYWDTYKNLDWEILVDSNTITFVVPDPSASGNAIDKLYSVVKDYKYPYNTPVAISSYDEDIYGRTNILVYHTTGGSSVSASGNYYIVDKITKGVNEEGEQKEKLYVVGAKKSTSFFIDTKALADADVDYIKDLKQGCVIQLSLNKLHEINGYKIVFDPVATPNPQGSNSIVSGSIVTNTGYIMDVDTKKSVIITRGSKIKSYILGSIPISVYNQKTNKIWSGKISDIEKDDYIILQLSSIKPMDIAVIKFDK